MASFRTLGQHLPSALPYLVAEGILPDEPSPSLYKWETYHTHDQSQEAYDELLATEDCVVWSRNGNIRKIFDFRVEEQKILQAVLTYFPQEEKLVHRSTNAPNGTDTISQHNDTNQKTGSSSFGIPGSDSASQPKRSRALVVLLKFQAHVFFLQGSSHLVNLPFEVEKAFPAPTGLILQRRLPSDLDPSTPRHPAAPPNSFFSPLAFSSQSFRMSQSFTTRGQQPWRTSNASGVLTLSNLLRDSRLDGPPEDSLPRLYSLTDPLSELGLVVHNPSTRPQSSYSSSTYIGNTGPKLEAIPKDEELLYISTTNENPLGESRRERPLLLAVTANYSTQKFSLWHLFYLAPLPASTSKSLARSSSQSTTSKPRRRSSFIPGTGTATPIGRTRNGPRESLGADTSKSGPSRSRTAPPSFSASQQSRDPDAEDALASQLDPDNEIGGAPGGVKESRRVSSLLSRGDLGTSFDRNAFQEMATQRTSLGTSFNSQSRMPHSLSFHGDRNSLGASQNSQTGLRMSGMGDRMSLGVESVDETLEDLLTPGGDGLIIDPAELEFAAEIGSLSLQEPISGLRREVVMSKFGELSMNMATPSMQAETSDTRSPRVFTLSSPISIKDKAPSTHRMFIHIMDHRSGSHIIIEYRTQAVHLNSLHSFTRLHANQQVESVLIPSLKDISRTSNRLDAGKIRDGGDSCLVTLDKDTVQSCRLILHAEVPITLDFGTLRLFDPFALAESSSSIRKSAGLNRRTNSPNLFLSLDHSGPGGTLDLEDEEGVYHRMEIQLRPRNGLIAKALTLFLAVLPDEAGQIITTIWWNVVRSSSVEYHSTIEWDAFVIAIFAFVVCFMLDGGNRTSKEPSITKQRLRNSDGKPRSTSRGADPWGLMWDGNIAMPKKKAWNGNAWAWAAEKLSSETNHSWQHRNQRIESYVERARSYLTSRGSASLLAKLTKNNGQLARDALPLIVYVLHILREEEKLHVGSVELTGSAIGDLCPILAQAGGWLGWDAWSWRQDSYYTVDGKQMGNWSWNQAKVKQLSGITPPFDRPPSVFDWLETASMAGAYVQFPTLKAMLKFDGGLDLATDVSHYMKRSASASTPRLEALSKYFDRLHNSSASSAGSVEMMKDCGIDRAMLETFPESVAAILGEVIAQCRVNPPTTWDTSLLQLVGRGDLDLISRSTELRGYDVTLSQHSLTVPKDVHHICESAERPEPITNAALADGSMITRLIFSQDQRFLEATKLTEPLRTQIAECPPDPSWSDTEVLEAQKTVVQYVMTRTFAIAPSQAMLHFDSRRPLPTEKFAIHGYTTMCIMKPMNITVTANREGYTEERYAWAWFHAGVSAGLSISKSAEGIDTSWIVFNKPTELTNRHAGLLLGLGLTKHLRSLAKWLSFKYLTPKHTMTSVGLLLGLSAAFLGTMDTLVTRLLSVHITRMLPSGAAELNLNPLTQTTGVMGIGLLYYNTQHRRMSEVMISEIEHAGTDDPSSSLDSLRDEGYRLAAGFSLGLINLATGKELKGLHDMRVVERLLAVAVGPRPVDLVHILDQATAGATIAIALIFMKTEDEAVASKINVPDTLPQFDFVRPDILLLRTLAKHLIMWNGIKPTFAWIIENVPGEYAANYGLRGITALKSEHLPHYNIVAGLLWAVSLKYAGSGDIGVRDFLVHYLDEFIRLCNLPALRYDAKLTRNTIRNCQDVVALSAATVMAGTGDLQVFRRLRLLHGRINADTSYGSHLAAHMAIGVLFLAGGRYTFSTSPLAIASLICAFYPLFPQDVLDNKAHLQAFRHLWVLAAEPRCLIVRDVDTHRAIPMPISILLNNGVERVASAPCLLPELHEIAAVRTTSPEYWPVILDFAHNPLHLSVFRKTQTLHVRRRPASEIHGSVFGATLTALNDAQNVLTARLMFDWIFQLPLFKNGQIFESAEWALVLPADANSGVYLDGKGTVVDHKLGLVLAAKSEDAERLWNLRCVLRWAEEAVKKDGRLRWLGWEVLEELRARVLERSRIVEG